MTDDAKPVLNQLNLVVSDMDAVDRVLPAARARRPRRRRARRHPSRRDPDGRGAQLDLDNEALAQVYNAEWRRPEGGQRVVVGFSLPTCVAVDDTYRELTADGYRGVQVPFDVFWGARTRSSPTPTATTSGS